MDYYLKPEPALSAPRSLIRIEYLSLFFTIILASCSPAPPPSSTADRPIDALPNLPEERRSIIESYIDETRNWPRDEYVVTVKRKRGKDAVYGIRHNSDDIPGQFGSKSFEITLDGERNEVVDELQYQ